MGLIDKLESAAKKAKGGRRKVQRGIQAASDIGEAFAPAEEDFAGIRMEGGTQPPSTEKQIDVQDAINYFRQVGEMTTQQFAGRFALSDVVARQKLKRLENLEHVEEFKRGNWRLKRVF